ncbi:MULTISPECIES: recombinase-like helix-turn-helix domain-containing protein [unclassified Acinetobacter]|uniref:recombinase-like helix-turn-helix domain-containing protein n=1 Tax=unclassified Acinetobacter TaxID=196816 RepID=UPI0012507B02|nr:MULTISPECIES: recombinase-like helix-turn-helix domain-containing protein [unclassified Acinetobacter]
METFNKKLANWIHATPATGAGINNIQIPGQAELLVWQTRYKVPTTYEQDFVQYLIKAFAAGVTELGDLVQSLNQQGFRCESGELWTSETFSEEMQRLGY